LIADFRGKRKEKREKRKEKREKRKEKRGKRKEEREKNIEMKSMLPQLCLLVKNKNKNER
jgi:hypothetical protein